MAGRWGVDIKIVAGPHGRCEGGAPLGEPVAASEFGYEQVSIVPVDSASCDGWFAIDLYFADFVFDIRLDLGQ